jgi:hypothetical protein
MDADWGLWYESVRRRRRERTMDLGGMARRPGLVLAVSSWVGFAALAAGALLLALATEGASIQTRVYAAALGFADLPSLLLVVAALLLQAGA